MRQIYRVVLSGTKKIKDMTEEEAKLLAQLIDDEGSIYATKSGVNIHPAIAVGMRSRMPVDRAELWGGSLCKQFEEGNWKYTWYISRRRLVRAFLLKINPYLELSRKQAEIALEMCDILDAKHEGYKKKLEKLKAELTRLNRFVLAPDIDITKLKGIKK